MSRQVLSMQVKATMGIAIGALVAACHGGAPPAAHAPPALPAVNAELHRWLDAQGWLDDARETAGRL